MVRYFDNNKRADGADKLMVSFSYNTGDTLPTDVAGGSSCLEIETGDWYVFDEKTSTWTKYGTLKEEE